MGKAVAKQQQKNFFSRFFWLSCHLWTQFSQLPKGQFGKLLCLSQREFPEVFETPPTFISSPFQSGLIAKKPRKSVFLGHPVYFQISELFLSFCLWLGSLPSEELYPCIIISALQWRHCQTRCSVSKCGRLINSV